MNKTKIEWLRDGYTWNPLAMRCDRVSEGCRNCWHLAMANRLAVNPKIPQAERDAYAGGAAIMRDELAAPLSLKRPATIAVQLMGDLFHPKVFETDLQAIWGIMQSCPQSTFIILTKRAARMHVMLERYILGLFGTLPNVWLGVSVEDQAMADERIPWLLRTPAAKRIVSYEPAIAPVKWELFMPRPYWVTVGEGPNVVGAEIEYQPGIDLLICGSETGPRARPMHPDWARAARDECKAAGVKFFFKGWGEWNYYRSGQAYPHGLSARGAEDGGIFVKNGRGITGRLLDGRLWEEMPT